MSLRAAEQDRPEIAHERASFQQQVQQLDPSRFVFVDEAGAATNLVRRYGRAPRGERARGTAPGGHYQQLTMLGALSLRGMVALMTVDGAADTDVVIAYVEHVLVPALVPGQIVFLDNLSPHKAARVRALIDGAGCQMVFLPPYSPDFSPIEHAWSKIKEALRSAAGRTREAIETALLSVLDRITSQDCMGWFEHCGYAIAPN